MAGPAADNIRAIIQLERESIKEATPGERIGDWIANVVGTMTFVTVQTVIVLGWIGWNLVASETWRFDPYPFGLLTFVVSLEGVLIATFVLISQNRMSRQTDQRDHLNLQISMLAEQEVTLMLRLLRRISDRLEIQETPDAAQAEKLTEETNVYELVRTLRRELPEIENDAEDKS
jgi:uncharacterized membrane protein